MSQPSKSELASLSSRMIAIGIDGILLGIAASFLVGGSRPVGSVLSFLLGLAYQWFFLTKRDGATLGKMLMKIRVIKGDGARFTTGDVVVRYIGYYVNNVLMLGWIWATIDSHYQGWHDKIANTYVVRSR